jgi:O-antigen ligase
MWLFIHRPFEVYPVLGSIHLERFYVFVCLIYWLLFHPDKRLVGNRMNLALGSFWLAVTLAYLASPYQDSERCSTTFQNYLKIVVFYPMVMTTVRGEKQLKLMSAGFLVGFAIYLTHSFREYFAGRHVFRMGIVRMIAVDEFESDPNSFASSILYAMTIAFAFWPEIRGAKDRFFLSCFFGLSVLCIILTGSRSGFVGLICLLAFGFRRLLRKKLLLLLVLSAIPLGWFAMEERLQNRFWTLIDPSVGPSNAEESAVSRSQGFNEGITLWERSPVLGLGPGAHGLATGRGMQAHNLYGQVLGETGTLGALTLLSVVLCFLANGWEARNLRRSLGGEVGRFPANLSAAIMMALMLLLIKGYSDHNLYRYTWLWFGAFQAIAVGCLRDRYREAMIGATNE